MDKEPARLPALKLIAFALMSGIVIFTAVAGAMRGSTGPSSMSPGMFGLIVGLVAISSLPLAAVVGPMFTAAARQQWPVRRAGPRPGDWLMNQFATLTIVRLAMVEAVGLVGATGLLLTGRWEFLAAPVLAVVLMTAMMPTESRARSFIQRVTGEVPR